jgi:aminoglycoside phosphotransferase (APT) family kinase protein
MNIDLFWFHEGEPFPRVVTKLCRQEEVAQREFENLKQVHATAGNYVPRPLQYAPHGPFWGLWMSGVPGSRAQAGQNTSPAILRSMAGMVTDIHRSLRSGAGRANPDRFRRMVVEPLRALSAFGTSALVKEGCHLLESRVTETWLNALPVIPQHGDLYTGNLVANASRWYVVDWESYGAIDLPFYDFLTLMFSVLRMRGETPDKWDPLLVTQIPSYCRTYCDEVGMESSTLGMLLPLALVNWFHLQWSDGREQFSSRMYKTITNYFEHTGSWEKVFLC